MCSDLRPVCVVLLQEGPQQQSGDARLLLWIGENPVSSTPDIPKPRPRRKSCRLLRSNLVDRRCLGRNYC